MIIKNISPYPKRIDEFGKYLMPGEQCDLSEFTTKQKEECQSLQEAFRKGEFICIGMGGPVNPDARLRAARARILAEGPAQPLLPILGSERRQEVEGASLRKAEYIEEEEPVYRHHKRKPQPPTTVDKPLGIVAKDKHGRTSITPIYAPKPEPAPVPVAIEFKYPTITPERVREIMAQRCISFRTNGKKCKRWAVKGYEYCINHMPKKLLEEYKSKKKQRFFRE